MPKEKLPVPRSAGAYTSFHVPGSGSGSAVAPSTHLYAHELRSVVASNWALSRQSVPRSHFPAILILEAAVEAGAKDHEALPILLHLPVAVIEGHVGDRVAVGEAGRKGVVGRVGNRHDVARLEMLHSATHCRKFFGPWERQSLTPSASAEPDPICVVKTGRGADPLFWRSARTARQ